MSWLARLKNGNAPETGATKPTKPEPRSLDKGYVGFVAPGIGTLTAMATGAANDPIKVFTLTSITATVDIGTVRPPGLSPLLLAASLALDASISAAGTLPGNDPDADCWPNSTAMNGAEIDLFTARLHRFTDKGLIHADGEALADKLVIRDREADDRRSCLECRHLSGYGHTSWRCGNWQAAGVAIRPRDTQLPADLVLQLQRCDGFASGLFKPAGRCDKPP